MTSNNSSMYKWERVSKPRVYSRSQRIASDTDIKDWIKTVESASEKAAAAAFDREVKPDHRRQRTQAEVHMRVEDARIHEAAYAEAQDLLQQWVNDKIRIDAELEYNDEDWTKNTESEIKRDWSKLLSSDADLEIDALVNGVEKKYLEKISEDLQDPYSILRRDQNEVVSEILDRMYEKEIVPNHVMRDLGLDRDASKLPDPRTKMTLRHQQVKENREKRLRDKEKQLKELQSRKDATFQARQMLLKEEKLKETQKRKEEQQIQAEMAKIKKEMEEERKKQAEEKRRMRKEREDMERRVREELEKQQVEEERQRRKSEYMTEEGRKLILRKMQQIEVRKVTENLKLKQRCFSAWYNMVIDRRLKSGKAKAMCDWRLMVKVFNAWKCLVREQRLEQQTLVYEQSMKQTNRLGIMADELYQHTLLRKCVTAWQLFVSQSQASKELEREQEKTRQKMQAFLQAAQSGQLMSKHDDTRDTSTLVSEGNTSSISAMFASRGRPATAETSRSNVSNVSSNRRSATHRSDTTLQAWQINKKHIQPTKQELQEVRQKHTHPSQPCTCPDPFMEGSTPCAHCQQAQAAASSPSPEHPTSGSKPWRKAPFAVNNFEHRHAAQQKILEMQQRQIQQQQKLIEELQYLQKQQMLQQTLLQEENTRIRLTSAGEPNSSESAATIHKTLHHLQKHIAQLQQQLLETGAPQLENMASTQLPSEADQTDHLESIVVSANKSSVQNIQITDLECESNIETPTNHGFKLDLSQVVEEPASSQTSAKTEDTKPSGFGETKVLSAKTSNHPNSTRSGVSSADQSQVSNTSRSSSTKHDNFLKKMEGRAQERLRIKKEREEKKRIEEELKMAELLAREAELRLAEEAEKARRLEEHKQRKREEKQREKEKQQFVERMKELTTKADQHYARSLVKWRGLYAFRKLVQMAREREQRAEQHFQRQLLKAVFHGWRGTVQKEVAQKEKTADQFRSYLVTKRCFRNWTKYKTAQTIQLEKARRHHEMALKVKVLREWADYAAEEKVSMWHKERIAREHNPKRLLRTYFRAWRRFPRVRQEEEARELRLTEMRRKVAGLLNDYEPVRVSKSNDLLH